jgi:hypothetical protein
VKRRLRSREYSLVLPVHGSTHWYCRLHGSTCNRPAVLPGYWGYSGTTSRNGTGGTHWSSDRRLPRSYTPSAAIAAADWSLDGVRNSVCNSVTHRRLHAAGKRMLRVARCVLHVARCKALHVARYTPIAARGMMHVACGMLQVACCTLHADCCMLQVACFIMQAACWCVFACCMYVVCCMLHVARCTLHAVCCTVPVACGMHVAHCRLHVARL